MREMMDFQSWKQHREEVMREVELSRLAKPLRAARKVRAGRFLKFLRALNGVS